jgi:flagella basal body P-ring formation protein FlgA
MVAHQDATHSVTPGTTSGTTSTGVTSINTPSRIVAGHPVATHDLARGVTLTANDIRWVADSDGAAGATDQIAQDTSVVAPGWVTRRAIRSGELLTVPSVAHADVITTGDDVEALYQDDTVTLRLKGTAIGSGAVGDHIYVKLDNRRRLRGVITGPHTVRVGQ